MRKWIRSLLAVVLGLLLGSAVNMALIMASGQLIPPPAGADVNTLAGLQAALPLFEPKHFVMPFLSHALGALVGALLAGLIAAGRSAVPPFIVGGMFMAGGIANVVMLPAPLWFNTLDLLVAYLPMAWLGARLAARLQGRA